ncbi:thioredoxin- transmembrane protein 4 [Nowakowskiella sp. JEL0407]|nr:thioredoxin- transmembrane protein 4 [Nowakowskiella sp. JEL0407]
MAWKRVSAGVLMLLLLSLECLASETPNIIDAEPPNPILSASPDLFLSESNYSVIENGTWLVQIYAPWCPFSQKLQQLWPEVVSNLSVYNSSYMFAKVNGPLNPKIASILEIRSYPSIKLIQDGNVWTYDHRNERYASVGEIVYFVQTKWKLMLFYNRLPKTWSLWHKLQLDIFHLYVQYQIQIVEWVKSLGRTVMIQALSSALISLVTMFYFRQEIYNEMKRVLLGEEPQPPQVNNAVFD